MTPKVALVTGANGYIGNATARAFVRAGWLTFGLARSSKSQTLLAAEEIRLVVGSIDDVASHQAIRGALPATPDVIVSTTENTLDFVPHFENILQLLRVLSSGRDKEKAPPLVLYTAGSKDYGVGPHYANDPDVKPHDEESSLDPPPFAVDRVRHAPRIFQHNDIFDAVLLRPTNVYGRASSYYSICFRAGEKAAATTDNPLQRVLVAPAQPEWISHALHIDDCSDAYVAIASAPRDLVRGEVFNISSAGFESAETILNAITVEYDIKGGVRYVDLDKETSDGDSSLAMVVGFPQWTSSEKLRRVTGWRDYRLPFSEDIHTYRLAYEASKRMGDENVGKIGRTIDTLMSTVEKPRERDETQN